MVITSASLLAVLLIQCYWIWDTARAKEALFNERARLVLTKTAEAITSDTSAIRNLQIRTNRFEAPVLDSIFNHYMKMYNIRLQYTYELRPMPVNISSYIGLQLANGPGGASYQTCLGGPDEEKPLELKLVFPDRSQYILAEMGGLFITSLLLIVVVLLLSWRTVLSLSREKAIAEQTRDFLNNMTHEFKTPMTNIALAGKMMQKESNITQLEKVRYFSGIILEENEKLRQQVDHVLGITALERGEMPLNLTRFSANEMVREAIERLSLLIETSGAVVYFKEDSPTILLNGDRVHLMQSVSNLIENAIKYSKTAPEITVETHDQNGFIEISVSDKGEGIPAEYHEKIFEKYFRVPTGDLHTTGGFGIGLAYVKTVTELHKGSIRLVSTPGEGSTFIITLPHE